MHKKMIKGILILTVILGGLAALAVHHYATTKELVFREELDEVILTVDDTQLTLSDIAMYVAYEELEVEEQAKVYDYYNTKAYWNLHTNGEFVKTAAKDSVIQMAVHDEIFYRMAMEENVTLDAEEEELVKGRQQDFWEDLSEEQREKLGVSKEQLDVAIEKTALAEKYQNIIAKKYNSDYDGYNIGEEPYETLLAEHTYQLNDKIWDRIPFGDIIVSH